MGRDASNNNSSGVENGGAYASVSNACLQTGEPWEDPDFPATQTSVFYHQTPPFTFQWKRPKELCSYPTFVSDAQTQFDIVPGKMGDRWLVSCLSVLYQNKGLFYRVVPADQTFSSTNNSSSSNNPLATSNNSSAPQYTGVFRFRLWWCGEWTEVLVDDRLPVINGRLAFLQCAHSDQYWPGLLEKAYAKLHGSYEALKYGTLLDGLADLTGGVTESIVLEGPPQTLLSHIARLLSKTTIVTCTHTHQIRNHMEKLPNGIQIGANYRVCALEKIDTRSGESITLLKLRDPFLSGNVPGTATNLSGKDVHYYYYRGPWSPGAPEWDTISASDRDRLETQLGNGEFWISGPELCSTFTHSECVHLDADTSKDDPGLCSKIGSSTGTRTSNMTAWIMKRHKGSWRRGVTAGGCRNNPDTFHINPQLQMTLTERDEIVISLNQHSVAEPRVIGFTVYESRIPIGNVNDLNSSGKDNNSVSTVQGALPECAPRGYFRKHKSLLNSQYTNSRQVSLRCFLDPGSYVILPTTFEPGQESDFTLRIYYTNRSLKLRCLDTSPARLKQILIRAAPVSSGTNSTTNITSCGFGQYEAVFMQLADEHKTINAFELQELLEACLPNDYIKSCANMEVCRQVVMTMDNTGSGRVKFSDFKDLMCSLKHWQAAFRAHSKEKAGVLRAERFRDALHEAGFRLGEEALRALVLRYMRKDGTMRFGDYVSAVLHLAKAFNIYESKDALQNGSMKMGLADWLKSTLTC